MFGERTFSRRKCRRGGSLAGRRGRRFGGRDRFHTGDQRHIRHRGGGRGRAGVRHGRRVGRGHRIGRARARHARNRGHAPRVPPDCPIGQSWSRLPGTTGDRSAGRRADRIGCGDVRLARGQERRDHAPMAHSTPVMMKISVYSVTSARSAGSRTRRARRRTRSSETPNGIGVFSAAVSSRNRCSPQAVSAATPISIPVVRPRPRPRTRPRAPRRAPHAAPPLPAVRSPGPDRRRRSARSVGSAGTPNAQGGRASTSATTATISR